MEFIILAILVGILKVSLGIIVYLQYQNRKQIELLQVKIKKLEESSRGHHNEILEHIAKLESEVNQSLARNESEFEEVQSSFTGFRLGVNDSFSAFKQYFEDKLLKLDTEIKRVVRQY